MQKDAEAIKKYWEERASSDSSVQSTTMDIWLRDIESRVVVRAIEEYKPSCVYDVGCGDGRTTIRCAAFNPAMQFTGFDYAASMINNANQNALHFKASNVAFFVGDIMKEFATSAADFIYTNRCLINLTDWNAQKSAIKNIAKALVPGGIYLMIENFVESQALFNTLRVMFDLPEIPVREHNTFFHRDQLLHFANETFDVLSEENISSSYYIVSRIIYSAMCKMDGTTPDYNDVHHQLAAKLPFLGEYGPVRAITFKKRDLT